MAALTAPTHAYLFSNYDVSFRAAGISNNITKGYVSICTRSSEYIKYKNANEDKRSKSVPYASVFTPRSFVLV